MVQLDYKEMLLAEVDTDGETSVVDCRACGKNAIKREWESAYTGSVNTYHSVDCGSCGHHICDVDGCERCGN